MGLSRVIFAIVLFTLGISCKDHERFPRKLTISGMGYEDCLVIPAGENICQVLTGEMYVRADIRFEAYDPEFHNIYSPNEGGYEPFTVERWRDESYVLVQHGKVGEGYGIAHVPPFLPVEGIWQEVYCRDLDLCQMFLQDLMVGDCAWISQNQVFVDINGDHWFDPATVADADWSPVSWIMIVGMEQGYLLLPFPSLSGNRYSLEQLPKRESATAVNSGTFKQAFWYGKDR